MGGAGLGLAPVSAYRGGMAEPRSYQIDAPRIRLNIVEWGDPSAPPLILQHGGRDHARSWDWVAQAFAGSHRVIVPDLRGHGDSEWSRDGGYDLFAYLEDFAALVRLLDLPPCAMVGHSLGGNIVTRFAGLYPDRVTRLVNIEGLGDSPEVVARRAAQDQLALLRDYLEERARHLARRPRDYPNRAALFERMRQIDPRLTPETVEHLALHAARDNPDGTVRLKHDPALFPPNGVDIPHATKELMWAAIACPVLLVYGADSWASNPAVDGRAGHFRDARVELFADAGHWVHHDRRADFITLLRDFLG